MKKFKNYLLTMMILVGSSLFASPCYGRLVRDVDRTVYQYLSGNINQDAYAFYILSAYIEYEICLVENPAY